jgi:hypothetical protein
LEKEINAGELHMLSLCYQNEHIKIGLERKAFKNMAPHVRFTSVSGEARYITVRIAMNIYFTPVYD